MRAYRAKRLDWGARAHALPASECAEFRECNHATLLFW